MRKTRLTIILTVFLCAVGYRPAISQDNLFLWGHSWTGDARSLGLAGAYSGVAEGFGALYSNAAGLGQTKTILVHATFTQSSVTNHVNFFNRNSVHDKKSVLLNGIGVIVPVPTDRGSLVFGFGVNRVKDYSNSLFINQFINTPGDSVTWEFERLEDGGLYQTSFAGSIEMAPGLFVGGAVNFYSGSNNLTWFFLEEDEPYNLWSFSDSTSTEWLDTKMHGVNVSASFFYKSGKGINIGGSIESPLTIRATENWEYIDEMAYQNDPVYLDSIFTYSDNGEFEYKITKPWKLRGGISFKAGPLLLTADGTYQMYQNIKYNSEPPEGNQIEVNRWIRHDLRNVLDWAVGGELAIPNSPVTIRAGYSVKPSPWKDDDNDRSILAFGGGIKLTDIMTLNAAYTYTSWKGSAFNVATMPAHEYDSRFDVVTEKIESKQILVGLTIGL